MSTSFNLKESILLIDRNPDSKSSIFYSLRFCWSTIVPLGPFDGRVAAILTDFVCTTPNQDRIYLPPMQRREVHLRADFRYGPDDPTLWPQPWVKEYPHLGAIPRKPDDCDNPLSIMWWDPTLKEFDSYNGGLVDRIGELLKSKFLEFEKMKKNLEDRVEDYKKTTAKPNSFLLLMVKAMQDACVRLGSLKTTFSEMRFGITEFQRYYLEVCGILDYIELYKPRMDGQKPAATTVAHCVGAVTNIARTVQDFHTAGLPIWFMRPQKSWDSPISCNILEVVSPLNPASSLCVSEHDPPFSPIFRGYATAHEKQGAIHSYSRGWLVFKDPFQSGPSEGNSMYFGAICFLTLPTGSRPLSIQSPEHSQRTRQGSSCESNLLSHGIFSYCRLSKPRSLRILLNIHNPCDKDHLVSPIYYHIVYFLIVDFLSLEASKNPIHWSWQISSFGRPFRTILNSCLASCTSGRRQITT